MIDDVGSSPAICSFLFTFSNALTDGTPWAGGQVLNSAGNVPYTVGPTTVMFESVFGPLRPEVRTQLADRSNPYGVYGTGWDACKLMDNLGYDPMHGNFLTTGSGNTNAWAPNAYRYAYDPTGFAHRFALEGADYGDGKRVVMPDANYFQGLGDGLNSAGHKWTTLMIGQGSSTYGTGGDPDRKSFTTRVDHNINNDHRVTGTFDIENFYVWNAYRVWPESNGGYFGDITRRPIRFSISLNSTIASSLLNEFRFGLSQSEMWSSGALNSPKNKDDMANVLLALAGNDASNSYYAGSWAQDQLMIIGLGDGDGGTQNTAASLGATAYRPDMNPVRGSTDIIDRSHPYGTRGALMVSYGGHDPRWSFGDTITWIKGTHSFKGGIEYMRQSSFQSADGQPDIFVRGGGNTHLPTVRGGITSATNERRRQSLANAAAAGLGWQNVYTGSQDLATGNPTGNYLHAYNLMTYFSGSLSDTSLFYFAVPDRDSPTGARWNDLTAGEGKYEFTLSNQEFSMFFKDDWRLTNNLTLNLGVRWEYYGVPHASDGLTLAMKGGSSKAWGISTPADFYSNGKGWVVDRNYLPGFQKDAAGNPVLGDPAIVYEFIGPETQNSNRMIWNRDLNNFAPHVGFAWQLPWFGAGLTTLRGGYSLSYGLIDNFNNFPYQFVSVVAAGTGYTRTFTGDGDNSNPNDSNYYMDLTDLKTLLPLRPAAGILPLSVHQNDMIFSTDSPNPTAVAIDENITNPYVHSLNMSLTRSIGNMFTVDVRYIGTFRRNAVANINTNQNYFLDTTLLNWITELDTVRMGDESMYINSLIPHNGPAGTTRYYSTGANQTGSDQLRQQQAANVARGGYNTIVSSLGSTNGQLPPSPRDENGLLMRSGCLPQDRPGYSSAFAANNRVDVTDFPCTVGTPLNMFYAAPQFNTVMFRHNTNIVNNYNSMQAQVTMRPKNGLSFQATYTWSRNIGNSGWTNYLDERDYTLSSQHRSHMLRTFGSYELPLGANGLFLRNASNGVRKAVEGWQLSWVIGMESGPPLNVTGSSVLYGRNWPVLVRSDLWDDKQGKARVEWSDEGMFLPGTYLGRDYIKVPDTFICNPERMSPSLYGGGGVGGQCVDAGGNYLSAAPYALALAEKNASGVLVPVRYDREYLGDDGYMYQAGDPVIVFRNADQSDGRTPLGNYKPGRMTAQGRFNFDMAFSKSTEFMEGKRLELRVDVQNILNHATPIGLMTPQIVDSGGKYVSIDPPTLNISNSTVMGQMLNKGGHRTFQGRLAIRF